MVLPAQWLEHIDVPRQQGMVAVRDGIVDAADGVDQGTVLLKEALAPSTEAVAAAGNHDTFELAYTTAK